MGCTQKVWMFKRVPRNPIIIKYNFAKPAGGLNYGIIIAAYILNN